MARIRKKLGGWGMSSEACFLQDVAEVVDSLHKTPHYSEFGQSMVRVTDVKYGELDLSKTFRVDAEVFAEFSRRYKPSRGDIIITRVGTYGVFGKVLDTNFCLGQNTAAIIPKTIAPDYLYAVLNSDFVKSQIESSVVGSTQKTLSLKAIKALQIPRFRPSQELVIGSLGATFDDRITILRETNTTLEAIAQALFKSWFEDFDPVHAKMQGRTPEGMDEATAALFPYSFEESELGPVPKGWRVTSIYDVAKVIYGAPFASKQFKPLPPGKPLVRIRDLKDERPGVYTEEMHLKGYLIQPGDITVGMDGEFRAYLWGGEEAWLNQRVCVFQPVNGANSVFLRSSISPLLAAVEASETATTVIHLGKNDIDRFKVFHPGNLLLESFASVTTPIYQRVIRNKQMIQNLAGLRDTLLPRLISGQILISDVQIETQAA